MEGSTNLTALFVQWWYGGAITTILKYGKAMYIYSADLFSARLCLSTIFDPWKRDVLSSEGLSLNEKFHVWSQNLASRIIGAMVKVLTLLGYVIFTFLLTIAMGLMLLIWFLYPAIIVYFIYRAFK